MEAERLMDKNIKEIIISGPEEYTTFYDISSIVSQDMVIVDEEAIKIRFAGAKPWSPILNRLFNRVGSEVEVRLRGEELDTLDRWQLVALGIISECTFNFSDWLDSQNKRRCDFKVEVECEKDFAFQLVKTVGFND